jgi:hypothetical protein
VVAGADLEQNADLEQVSWILSAGHMDGAYHGQATGLDATAYGEGGAAKDWGSDAAHVNIAEAA